MVIAGRTLGNFNIAFAPRKRKLTDFRHCEERSARRGKPQRAAVSRESSRHYLVKKPPCGTLSLYRYEGTDLVSGDDGFQPMFELREVEPPTLPPKA